MKNLIYLFLISELLLACQPKIVGQSPTDPVVKPQVSDLKGGGDTVGGGNTIKKKPIEAYAKKVSQSEAYQLKVSPLIEKLKVAYPRLAADFIHLTNNRVWYFIPVSLDKIKSALIGTYSPEVDQTAVQDLNAVWFDSNLFDEMEPTEQGRLIIHELVMGSHLLEFKPRLDRCYAKAATNLFEKSNEAVASYDSDRESCKKNYLYGVDQISHQFSISTDDYNIIRKIVIELTSDDPDFKQVKMLIEENKIRQYSD